VNIIYIACLFGLALTLSSPSCSAETFAQIDEARIAQIEAMLPDKPKGFGPTYHNRSAFEALLAQKNFAGVIPTADKMLTATYPEWSDDAYLDYSRTGRRPMGERMLHARQAPLATLVWAECLEDKGRFVPALNTIMEQLAKQKTWTLPAHDGKLTNYNGTQYEVELNSAALAHDLAQSLYMLDDKVDPAVRKDVMDALNQRIFAPVHKSLLTDKGNWWMRGTNNWNAVCLAGVTGAALAALPERHDRAEAIAAAECCSRNFVKGFTRDGYCNEGLGYYDYGFGNFLILREELWQSTVGKVDLFADPKMRNMALYGIHMEIQNGAYPSIGDCPFGAKLDKKIPWYCSRVLGLGLTEYEDLDTSRPGGLSDSTMYTFPNSASQAKPAAAAGADGNLRSYFDDAGVLICRPGPGGRLGVALAGGNNGKSHNHNDVGSFSIVLGGEMPVGDPGGPKVYDADTFGPLRYTKFQIFRSRTHPTPVVAGREQKPGIEHAAKILKTDFSDTTDTFAMDLSGAYTVPEVKKLDRTFIYSREGAGSLVVRDEFEYTSPQSFEISLETHGTWTKTAPDTLNFQMGKENLIAVIQASAPYTITAETCTESATPFTRLGIALNAPCQAGTVTVTFKPAVN